MPGQVLTVSSTIQCPHGGRALLTTGNTKMRAEGAFALLETDVHTVVGCPFTVGSKYSPCLRIEWSAGASLVQAQSAVLVRTSVGKCFNGENVTQGVALIATTQSKVSAR
jgi:hypothetical protein